MKQRIDFYTFILIYLGIVAVVGTLTETTWWRWVFFVLALCFLGRASYRLQKRWGIK